MAASLKRTYSKSAFRIDMKVLILSKTSFDIIVQNVLDRLVKNLNMKAFKELLVHVSIFTIHNKIFNKEILMFSSQ